MINYYVISIMRKGATKPTIVSCQEGNHLSLCQILQSTDDVASYQVGQIGKDFALRDMYIKPSNEQSAMAWSKWQPIEAEDGHNPNA